jgi:hypothetical protein
VVHIFNDWEERRAEEDLGVPTKRDPSSQVFIK